MRLFTFLLSLALFVTGLSPALGQRLRPKPYPQPLASYRQQFPLPEGGDFSGASVQLTDLTISDAELDAIQAAGFSWVRLKIAWASVEFRPNRFNFTTYDDLLSRLAKRRMRAIIILGYGKPVYTGGEKNPPLTRTALIGWRRYVRECVMRYGGKGHLWEIWNEPMLSVFWPSPSPTDYAFLVRETSRTIRALRPEEWICGIAGAFPNSLDEDYIERAMEAGVLEDVDAVSMHPYVSPVLVPEDRAADWLWMRGLIALYAPPGKRIRLVSSEAGFSSYYAEMTPTVRGRHAVRYMLSTLVSGIGVISYFGWRNLPSDPNLVNTRYGLLDESGAETTALVQIRRVLGALKGWSYSKRLRTDSPADYLLLFSRGAESRLVAWTTGADHTVTMDSSPGSLTASTSTGNTTLGVVANRVTFPLSGDPLIAVPNGPNPLLLIAGQWGRAPATATIGSIADARAAFENLVVSPAWADAPSGTTLTVEDQPDAQPAYARAGLVRTYGALGELSSASPDVQELWNSLPCIQDQTQGTHTLRFTLTLPDGTVVTQTTTVIPSVPLAVDVRAPVPDSWSVTVRNPSGRAFVGSAVSYSGGVSETQPVVFAPEEREKVVVFPTISHLMIRGGVETSLFSSDVTVRDPSSPVVQTRPIRVSTLPAPTSSWIRRVGGDPLAALVSSVTYGPQMGSPLAGSVARVAFDTIGLWSYIDLTTPVAPLTTAPLEVGMWVKGDNSYTSLQARFQDANGEMHQSARLNVNWTGWRWIRLSCSPFVESWGSGANGVVELPVTLESGVVVSFPGYAINSSISIQGITIIAKN